MLIKFSHEDESMPSKFLNDGVFNCAITKMEHKNSKAGDAMVEAEFTDIVSGKTTREWFMVAAGFNKFKLLQLVKAAGLNPQSFDTEQLLRKQVCVTRTKSGEREYNGKIYPDYQTEYSAVSGAIKQEDTIPF